MQDRFQHIVPILNKLGNTTVGLTLILIGVLGIVESRQHQQEQAEQLQPVTTEGTVIQGEFFNTWVFVQITMCSILMFLPSWSCFLSYQ